MSSNLDITANALTQASKKLRSVPLQKRALHDAMAWLDCGDYHLLFPSDDIVTLMPLQLMTPEVASTMEAGFVEYDHHRVPVFNLSKGFQLQPQLSNLQKIIVVFKQDDIYFGLVGRELTKLSDVSLKVFSVPVCMSSRKQPFIEFTIHNQRAAGISSAKALLTLIRLRGVKSLTVAASTRKLGDTSIVTSIASDLKSTGAA